MSQGQGRPPPPPPMGWVDGHALGSKAGTHPWKASPATSLPPMGIQIPYRDSSASLRALEAQAPSDAFEHKLVVSMECTPMTPFSATQVRLEIVRCPAGRRNIPAPRHSNRPLSHSEIGMGVPPTPPCAKHTRVSNRASIRSNVPLQQASHSKLLLLLVAAGCWRLLPVAGGCWAVAGQKLGHFWAKYV